VDDPRTLVEVFEAHSALRGALDWPALLDLLTPLRPRHYSVSSSPATDPGHADLMVSLLEAPARSGLGTYTGVGSGHLHTVKPGDTVLARLQPCREAFRIDDSAPVVPDRLSEGGRPRGLRHRGPPTPRPLSQLPLPDHAHRDRAPRRG
jgi:cytochrome P450/NADPH-cytochrome P450 reductase